MSTTVDKPGRGKPQTEAQRLAVLAMENDVVHRYAVQGHSFYRIEKDLGITHADRIYKRAMSVRPVQQRTEAYEVQRKRLDALHAKAWEALESDGLAGLTERVVEMVLAHDGDEGNLDTLLTRIRSTIEKAYADTYKAVPVALQVHDRFVKLDGLDHAARVADASLAIEEAKLRLIAGGLFRALGILDPLGVTDDHKRAVVAELERALESEDEE